MNKTKRNLFSATHSVAKKGTVAMLCMILFGLISIAGCRKDHSNSVKEPEYPIEIPLTEYTIPKTCQWTNLAYNNLVVIINSEEELTRYITSIDGIFPEIDFTTHTLLIASGKTDFKVAKKTTSKLQQLSENEYELDVEIFMDGTEISYQWAIATIIEKVSEESNVKLNITCEKSDYPVEIPFMEYINNGTHRQCWTNLNFDEKVIIINSSEQLYHYVNADCYRLPVDFSKNSILLVNGFMENGIAANIAKKLQQISLNEYELDAEIIVNTAIPAKGWVFALIVDKLSEENTFKLNVTYRKEPDENVPYKEECDDWVVHYPSQRTYELMGVLILYIDTLPKTARSDYFASYMLYDKSSDKVTVKIFEKLVTSVPVVFKGTICNFPDFAKEWKIPSEGKQIYYKGTFHRTFTQLDIFGGLVLKTLELE